MTASKKLIQASAGNVAGSDFYPYTVDNSARFNDNDSAYLTRTPASAGNRTVWTFSTWAKLGNPVSGFLLSAWAANSDAGFFGITTRSTGELRIQAWNTVYRQTSAVYRDPSAWYHIVLAVDTTQATADDRFKLYVNGVQVTNFSTNNAITQNSDTQINNTSAHTIGKQSNGSDYFDGYMAQTCFIDGQALDPTSFGEEKNGVWVPKDVSGLTFGTNGFYLDFSNSGALGTDVSGNGNNFTTSGLTSSDQMIDTPTNSFCTWNPISTWLGSVPASRVLSEGNLQSAGSGSGVFGTFSIPKTGKWYWETYINNDSGNYFIGIDARPYSGMATVDVHYFDNGNKYVNGVPSAYGAAFTTGDRIGVLVDSDADTITFYKNNSSQGAISLVTSIQDIDYFPFVYQDGAASYNNTDFGQLGFTYTPPTDALALCTANLPEPTIGPNSATITSEVFEPILYTGNGTSQSISTLEFQPDFTWIKNRDAADNHMLFDALRGATKYLSSNTTSGENTDAQSLSSFNSNGFSVGNNVAVNTNAEDYVAWNWKGNGSGVTNTDGSITSTVSANTDAGFSIVTYTGTGSSMTFGHGLGQPVDFMLVKKRDTADGWVVHPFSVYGTSYILSLNSNIGIFSDSVCHTNNSTVIGFTGASGARNLNGGAYVAYCFAEVEGFSSFGSYTGNGSATDGPFVFTGFKPAFVIFKRTDSTSDWNTHDASRSPYNVSDDILWANLSTAETTGSSTGKLDFLSNGIKIRGSANGINTSGATYIYMAFAENPFKYANAR